MPTYTRLLRITRQLFVLSLALFLAKAADAQPLPKSAKEVIDRYLAVSGAARSAAMRHRHMVSEVTMGNMPPTRSEIFMSDGRFLLTGTPAPGMTSQTGFDGKVAWTIFNGEPMLLADSLVAPMRKALANPMAAYDEVRSMRLGGVRDFRGEQVIAVHTVMPDSNRMTQLFSLRSGLPLAMKMTTPDSDDFEPDMIFEDYRATEGIMMAHKVTTRAPGGQGDFVMRVTHVDYRAPADSLFVLPKAVQALLPKP